jgi:hypothetical protein
MAKRKSGYGSHLDQDEEDLGVDAEEAVPEVEAVEPVKPVVVDEPVAPVERKPWLGYWDAKTLSAEDAALIAGHEDRVVRHNMRQRELGLPEALTKEAQDLIP